MLNFILFLSNLSEVYLTVIKLLFLSMDSGRFGESDKAAVHLCRDPFHDVDNTKSNNLSPSVAEKKHF